MGIKIFRYIILAFWSFAVIFIFSASLKNEIIFIDRDLKKNISTIFPQGWGFFTKSPRDQAYFCYELEDTKYIPFTIKNCSYDNLFGFSRKARIIGYESSQVIEKIYKLNEWSKVQGEFNLYYIPKKTVTVVVAKKLNYFKDKKYLFVRYFPIPWAWNGRGQEKYRPIEYLLVDLKQKK